MEGSAFLESMMEHIAVSLNLDPINFRLNNAGKPEVKRYLTDLLEWAEVRPRQKQIEQFNRVYKLICLTIFVLRPTFRKTDG